MIYFILAKYWYVQFFPRKKKFFLILLSMRDNGRFWQRGERIDELEKDRNDPPVSCRVPCDTGSNIHRWRAPFFFSRAHCHLWPKDENTVTNQPWKWRIVTCATELHYDVKMCVFSWQFPAWIHPFDYLAAEPNESNASIIGASSRFEFSRNERRIPVLVKQIIYIKYVWMFIQLKGE